MRKFLLLPLLILCLWSVPSHASGLESSKVIAQFNGSGNSILGNSVIQLPYPPGSSTFPPGSSTFPPGSSTFTLIPLPDWPDFSRDAQPDWPDIPWDAHPDWAVFPWTPPPDWAKIQKGSQAYEAGNYQQAFEIWEPLADQGNVRAQYEVGNLYYKGFGVEQNFEIAAELFKNIFDRVNVEADLSYNGNTGTKGGIVFRITPPLQIVGYGEAAKFYRLEAGKGDSLAQFIMGHLYEHGKGVSLSHINSYMWLSIAAKNEYERARRGLEVVEEQLTPTGLKQAQTQAKRCIESGYKDCD